MRFTQTNGTRTCVICPPGVDCSGLGNVRETLQLRAGYWRKTNESEGSWIDKCFNTGACIGGTITVEEGTECATGHMGPYCGVCDMNCACLRQQVRLVAHPSLRLHVRMRYVVPARRVWRHGQQTMQTL